MVLNLANKQVAVVGLGLTGQSCVRFLLDKGANVSAFDSRESLNLSLPAEVQVKLGPFDADSFCQAQLILLSPGLALAEPAIQAALKAGVEVIGDIELFARFNHKPVVAITGSNGKSTVTSLATDMLNASGVNAKMGGNIGTPVLELLDTDYEVAVLELSSFQLETTHSLAPVAATVLNISADHLDRYTGMQAYQQAKLSIYQGADLCVYSREDKLTVPNVGGKAMSFGLDNTDYGMGFDADSGWIRYQGQPLVELAECSLVGQHNVLNIQASAALALAAGATIEGIRQACREFKNLPHRCELVRVHRGVRWVDDSKGTNIGATLAAIEGLRDQVKGKLVLIAGGDGKGADFNELLPALGKVDKLICLGKDGAAIAALKQDSSLVASLEEAVSLADGWTQSGDMVLLSPACASLDMFKNYHHRGQVFATAVEALL
ncbi:UDP-N-acetylmuramoyl-L-alanine--D-glutamate ligase [Bowmanella sp. Y26]|uniref:UDP-N-acetylmuramoyl-L-alanine--D-glutamate ligase n=1 Tax=Bowmanella yangjiangensis TaxID=2811230 RepID=UPI001BDD8C9E|nr:UDP-N-acetylmuramoyl-L-alanine--D-glutamate ligase [Bowmanella yangjiangensis]MBT1062083.1 UDP-N-acetylmuramoyl-L-alanine--D-glutamate ligase [Bowmanella yangjiangensis]